MSHNLQWENRSVVEEEDENSGDSSDYIWKLWIQSEVGSQDVVLGQGGEGTHHSFLMR
jgi:hypothetical protein